MHLGILFYGLPWWLRQWRIHLQCKRLGFDPWVEKIPWRGEWLPTPVFLPVCINSLQSCPAFCDLMDHSLSGSSVHGIGVACHALLHRIFPTQGLNLHLLCLLSPTLAGGFFTTSATWEALTILAWKIPWERNLVGYSPWGRKESDITERLSTHTHTHPILKCTCASLFCIFLLELAVIYREVWHSAVHGVAKSWTWLSDWTTTILKLLIPRFWIF